MDLDNSLDILKSLSKGVKEKISIEDSSYEDDMIYVVNTSLKSKKNHKLDVIEIDERECKDDNLFDVIIDEDDCTYDTVIDDVVIDDMFTTKSRLQKIDRNGNVFSRGGKVKKKKESTVDWRAEREKRNRQLIERKKSKDNLNNTVEVKVETVNDVNEDILYKLTSDTSVDDVNEDLNLLNNMDVDSDDMDSDDIDSDDINSDDIDSDDIDSDDIDSDDIDSDDADFDKDNIAKSTELGNDILKLQSKQSKEEDIFSKCYYYPGMNIEEFLDKNKKYREAIFVEHFYSKTELMRLVNRGLILFKNGQYIF